MHRATRIVALAAVAIPSFLLGMRSSPQDPAPRSAAIERYEAVKELEQFAAQTEQAGRGSPWDTTDMETRILWSRRRAEAAIDAGAATARDAYAQHVARIEALLRESKQQFDVGRASVIDLALVRYHVADAKLLLERAGRPAK